ncbi:CIC11C00000000078 [Sungouiella intermedia]|uniref:Mediator of RNA polymerase II transcription subunit 7 n=1 Tax=Sungouiella intermedia TaxID=45354 RepID=A0A1L0DP37_9ASCO|nr:CIC11C00000000078 [[Candida] intermedia]
MADDLISSLYPPPPPYYKYFTDDNVTKFEEWKKTESEGLPKGELSLQVPPEVPLGDQYRGYGSIWALENKLPSLKELGWRQLYNDHDETITSKQKIDELHKLLDSLLLNFLELVGLMSVEPAKFYVKVEDLKLILININHLLNTYRPHQTRESLIMLLKKQIESKKAEILEIDKVTAEVKEKILGLVLNGEIAHLQERRNDISESGEPQEQMKKLQLLRELMEEQKK